MPWLLKLLEVKEPDNKVAPGSSPSLLLFPANEMIIKVAIPVNEMQLTIENSNLSIYKDQSVFFQLND